MKTIIMSIQPKWLAKILNGEKKIEVRKTAPKPPFKVVVYCTKGEKLYLDYEGTIKWSGGYHINENNSADNYNDQLLNGKVIGEFICDKVDTIVYTGASYKIKGETTAYTNQVARDSCLEFPDLRAYLGVKGGKALHIIAPKLYDKPKELGEFYKPCIMPETPYCPACKYGNVQYSPDEVECASDLEGASCEWLCRNSVKRPPQSYMRIQCTEED